MFHPTTLSFRVAGTDSNLDVGELQSVDGYMNIALEKTEEFVNDVKKRSYGDAFVRGNNGELRCLQVQRCPADWYGSKFCTSLQIHRMSQKTTRACGSYRNASNTDDPRG